MALITALSVDYIPVTVVSLALMLRWNGERRALTVALIYYTYGTLHWGLMAYLTLLDLRPTEPGGWARVALVAYYVLLSALCLAIAQITYNRWNRPRKRRNRAAGRVAVRLGRLVLIPEGR